MVERGGRGLRGVGLDGGKGKSKRRGVKKQVFLRVQGDFSTRSTDDGPSANHSQGGSTESSGGPALSVLMSCDVSPLNEEQYSQIRYISR
jgi:hypothetical protein